MFSTTLAGWRPVVRIVRGTTCLWWAALTPPRFPFQTGTANPLHNPPLPPLPPSWSPRIAAQFAACSHGLVHKGIGHGENIIIGFDLPPGSKVSTGAAIYIICRSKEVFGQDADVFRPERRLEAKEAARLEMETSEKDGIAASGLGEAGRHSERWKPR
ncbi:uncharacterized protein B0T23DRAFT_47031 [Neurospora hispaniola]|uniref:Uncharacterized protein n=1 Tax=Neurospora hispaniola TaxID=588809 RepID=A0AAJ0HYS5_9PEZI|nr:hypothetical protein B0T23DRAFT_47031 [Neurospora hispaniola]